MQSITEGPFALSKTSDGENEYFSAYDAAAGVSIPGKTRAQAEALVASLNKSCAARIQCVLDTLTDPFSVNPATLVKEPGYFYAKDRTNGSIWRISHQAIKDDVRAYMEEVRENPGLGILLADTETRVAALETKDLHGWINYARQRTTKLWELVSATRMEADPLALYLFTAADGEPLIPNAA